MATNNNFIHPDRCGVTVIGTATVRLFPDGATIVAAVSRSETLAQDAMAKARDAAGEVTAYLKQKGIRNFSASRITLHQEFSPRNGDKLMPGYRARIGFNIKLNDLDQVEEVVGGLIAAGANELASITYQSSVIQEARNDARRQAINAAREKANLFCQEVGLTVGRVMAINEILAPPAAKAPPIPGAQSVNDPTDLSVAANVEVTFEIERADLE